MKTRLFLVLVVLSGTLSACVPSPPIRTGKPISPDNVALLSPGTTTKAQVLDRFGLPFAIAAPGEIVEVQSERVWSPDAISVGGNYQLDADTWFELFADRRPFAEEYRIYFYFFASSRQYAVIGGFAFYQSSVTKLERLWLLVDERKSRLIDYRFRHD